MQRLRIFPLLLVLLAFGCSDSSGSTGQFQAGDVGTQADTQADTNEAVDVAPDTSIGTDTADEPDVEADVSPDMEPEARCGDTVCAPSENDIDCPSDCYPAPLLNYDPLSGFLWTYPDDFFTEPDSETVTGLRVTMSAQTVPEIGGYPDLIRPVFDALVTLDGFGTSAGAFLRFTKPLDPATIPSGEASIEEGSPLVFGYLTPDAQFVAVPVETVMTDDDHTIIFRPMVPLPAATKALMGVTRGILGKDGLPIEPNHIMAELLAGETTTPELERMVPRIQEAAEALIASETIASTDILAGLVPFTTQSIVEESLALAARIKERDFEVSAHQGCEDRELYRTCRLTFEVPNFRDERGIVVPEDTPDLGTYTLPVVVYLPYEAGEHGESPYPVGIFGHGLSGEKTQGRRLADFAAPIGWATIAIDAPQHGDHPQAEGDDVLGLLNFFGITFSCVDALVLRDNWRQATLDKLALIELLKSGVDADNDGITDLDAERIVYLGVSLGGIMGSEMMAMTEDIEAAVLAVPGARVTDIVQFAERFEPLIALMKPAGSSDGDVDRFWPFMQTIVDRGDPVNYAPHVLRNRLVGEPSQILMGMVIDDDTVPETTNFTLARAMGIPLVPPMHRSVGLIPTTDAAPVAGNLPGGGTAGLVQIKWILEDEQWSKAEHDNVGDSTVGAELWFQFLNGYLRDGTAIIVDPYDTLGLTPPAE